MLTLSEKLKYLIEDLKSQEQLCIQKYEKNACQAKDPVLKDLFKQLQQMEQTHFDSLNSLLQGTVPTVNSNDTAGEDYNPTPTYVGMFNEQDKQNDQFLCTDAITTEKYVSSSYNFNLYQFGEPSVRRLLNDIQTEEQNHAEKIFRYKAANQMT